MVDTSREPLEGRPPHRGVDDAAREARDGEPATAAFEGTTGLVQGAGANPSFQSAVNSISKRSLTAAREDVMLERRQSSHGGMAMDDEELPGELDLAQEFAKLPRWQSTLTVRALIISAILGACFSIISLKLGLTTGVIPSLNIGAGLLGFFFLGGFHKALKLIRINGQELTAQEVTVIQTCTVACYGMAFSGGFATYVIAMDRQSYENVGELEGNRAEDVVDPDFSRLIAYMACISLFGIFMLVPLRKQLILKYQLLFPSGTATGLMINSFFSIGGNRDAHRQIVSMGKWFGFSFLFSGWKWIFSGTGDCGAVTGGLGSFPTFSMQALDWTWNFDFGQNYIGVGMLCPQIVSWSIMFGAIISWGIMWPLIAKQEGDWYLADLKGTDFRGLYGYKVFLAISVFIVDGAYLSIKLIILTAISIKARRTAAIKASAEAEDHIRVSNKVVPGDAASALPGTTARHDESDGSEEGKKVLSEDMGDEYEGDQTLMVGETAQQRTLRRAVFVAGAIPWWVGVAGFVCMLAIAIGVIPTLYSQAKWYYVLVAGIIAPPLAFANAYGAGLTDWNMASLYGKLAIFIFASWAGLEAGGVIAGLAVCGVVFSSVAAASDLMQDFRTGYLTLSNPRAMFTAQLVGALMGCIIAPACFWLFWTAFPVGVPNSLYFAPYGTVYRGMAIVGVGGVGVLPKNCLALCGGFALITIGMNLMRDLLPRKYGRLIPLPMCMALPFYLGAWLAVDMCIGATIMLIWNYVNSAECTLLAAAAASGLIAGDGIWTIPAAILAIANVAPPICMGWSMATSE